MLSIGNSIGIPFSRRSGAGFDPDYQAVLDYATTQGYTLPSVGQQALQNQLVLDLKAAGVWSKLDALSVFATDGSSDFALIDWVRLITQNAISSPTFVTNSGYEGDAVAAYIDSLLTPSIDGVNFQQNSASLIAQVYKAATDANAFIIGNLTIRFRNLNTNNQRLNTSVDLSGANLSGTGVLALNRTNSTDSQTYVNGTLQASTATATSSSLDSFSTRILSTPSFGGRFTDAGLGIVIQGGSFNGIEHGDISTAINNYIYSL